MACGQQNQNFTEILLDVKCQNKIKVECFFPTTSLTNDKPRINSNKHKIQLRKVHRELGHWTERTFISNSLNFHDFLYDPHQQRLTTALSTQHWVHSKPKEIHLSFRQKNLPMNGI